MGLLASVIIGFGTALAFAVFLFWLDRYEKEPILLLGGVFIWGAVVAAGSAFLVNTVLGLGIFIFTNSASATDIATGSLIAPFVEECLKGSAVLFVFLVFRREFDSVLDGIIYAGVTALGFAATENAYYIFTYGYQEAGWNGLFTLSFIRTILLGWQHPFYTTFFGIGLAIARMNRSWLIRIFAPLLGLSVGMFTHAFHNTFASLFPEWPGLALGTLIDWTGWLFMLVVIIFSIFREGQVLKAYLAAEVQAGSLSPSLFQTVVSPWRQFTARLSAIFTGKYIQTSRFFQLCAEYSHKRRQYASLGDEGGSLELLQQMRAEMTRLAPIVQT